jgi:excisionase family DNA binding protein
VRVRLPPLPEEEDMEKGYLTPKEAAEYLGVSLSTIYLWKNQRKIKVTTVGMVVRFKVSDLDLFMATHSRSAKV